MRLENIVRDTRDPHRLGRFWAAALGAELITDDPDIVEARMVLADDAFLDLCFPRVAAPSTSPARLHLDLHGGDLHGGDLHGGDRPREVVERLLSLGAEHADIGQGDVPWTVLADPEGEAFCVLEERPSGRGTGPIAALPLDSAEPVRDAAFWAEITGWVAVEVATGVATLCHPRGVGPLLQLCPEPEPKRGKNRLHLDVRRDPGEGDPTARLVEMGASRVGGDDDLPWLLFTDPSGNEFCVLDPPRAGAGPS